MTEPSASVRPELLCAASVRWTGPSTATVGTRVPPTESERVVERAAKRYFTVAEARALVPQLRGILVALQAEKRELDRELAELRRLAPLAFLNGHGTRLQALERRVNELARAIREKVREIHDLGVEVKDLDMGLVDFPSLREGREVYLCWKVDEPTVAFWHELDAGFRGRQPLDD